MKLSVLMITYNHEKFIAQALDSILMQEVNFDYEIVIGEDCSTDTTREIVIGYQKKHPDKIRLLLPEKNLGMIKNFVATFKACKGEYIALLEGDDYWTDPLKLQRQMDIFDGPGDYAICFHNMRIIYDYDSRLNRISNSTQKTVSSIKDLAMGNYIYTASCMFRNNLKGELPRWIIDLPVGDYILHLLNAQFGDIYFIDKVMGVYRVHKGGSWESKAQAYRVLSWVKLLEAVSDKFSDEVNILLRQQKYAMLESNLSSIDRFNYINNFFYTLSIPKPHHLMTSLKKIYNRISVRGKQTNNCE